MSAAAILEASSPAQIEPTYHQHAANARPVSIYELHPGSWMRVPEQNFRPLTGAELAPRLAEYVDRLNFTHVQMLFTPDHPNGVQAAELQPLIEKLQERNIGVILDGAEFLCFAGRGTLPGIGDEIPEILRQLPAAGVRHGNVTLLNENGNAVTLTWDARWSPAMRDYFGFDPIERKFHHAELFAHDEVDGDFLLPLSHNDVSGGRRSLLARMPGDEWQRFANLRLLLANLWARPGKKLLFMGGEFGQWSGWNPEASLDWHLVRPGSLHQRLQLMVGDLNQLYRLEPALQSDGDTHDFIWGDRTESELSVIDWLRTDAAREVILAAFNFTPVPRHNHRVGVPRGGIWREVFNSDALEYGGSGQGNLGGLEASPFGWKQHSHSLTLTLPPLGAVFFKAMDRS